MAKAYAVFYFTEMTVFLSKPARKYAKSKHIQSQWETAIIAVTTIRIIRLPNRFLLYDI